MNTKTPLHTIMAHLSSGMRPLILLFLLFTPVALTPWIHGNDGPGYYAYVRSAIIDGDLDFANEHEHFSQDRTLRSIRQDPTTGRYFSQYAFGTALLWTPFFLIGHALAAILDYPLDGYSAPYVTLVSLGSAIYGLLALIFTYLFLRRFYDHRTTLLATITLWLAGNLFYYMYFEPIMSHANSAFTTALFLYLWHKTRGTRTTTQWAALGIITALAALIRYQNIIFACVLLFDLAGTKPLRDHLRAIIAYTATLGIGLSLHALILYRNHGTLIPSYDGAFNIWNIPQHFIPVLFSNQHGLLNWTPILLPALIGLYYLRTSTHGRAFILLFLLNTLIVAGWNVWYGAQSYGHRFYLNMTIPFAFGLADVLHRLNRHVKFHYLACACALFALWNIGQMIQYGIRLIDSAGPVPLSERAYNNLFVIPQKIIDILKTFILNRTAYLQ